MTWREGHGEAGEVRQGSEAKGNAGRVEVRQARSDEERLCQAGIGWKGEMWMVEAGMARLGVER